MRDTPFPAASVADASAMDLDEGAIGPRNPASKLLLTGRDPGYIFIHAVTTTRNIHVTITNHKHNPVVSVSAGQLGFKHSKRATTEAGIDTSINAFQRLTNSNLQVDEVEVVLKGFGKGRLGFLSALMSKQGDFLRPKVVRITDATPLRIGSVRAKNLKRR
jgi:small subunit ribosomal protein S11